ncbi:MAG: hypothetical protein F4118_00310 [Acidimicrobiaceae bacterium]|nr:hypothetical protein [Candidatus Poribacteria bacterium]MYI34864.1 hypothetical protein [Acidimicrobiaceae bacterium]
MTEEKTRIRYNPDLQRSEQTKLSLEKIGERKGYVTGIFRDGVAPTPIITKACPHCQKPSPATNKGFVCIRCVVIFR